MTPANNIVTRFEKTRTANNKYRQNIEIIAKMAGASAESPHESSQHVFSVLLEVPNCQNSFAKGNFNLD